MRASLFLPLCFLGAYAMAQWEGDRVSDAKRRRTAQLEAFKSFTGVNLNGQYGPKMQSLIGETLAPYEVKWGAPSPTVPVMWFMYETQEDKLLPEGYVIATLSIDLRTELGQNDLFQTKMIKQPWGVARWTFVAVSKEAAESRACEHVVAIMKQFGELWRESHPKEGDKAGAGALSGRRWPNLTLGAPCAS